MSSSHAVSGSCVRFERRAVSLCVRGALVIALLVPARRPRSIPRRTVRRRPPDEGSPPADLKLTVTRRPWIRVGYSS